MALLLPHLSLLPKQSNAMLLPWELFAASLVLLGLSAQFKLIYSFKSALLTQVETETLALFPLKKIK